MRASREEPIQRLRPVTHHDHWIPDVVLFESAQRERLIVRVVLDKEDHLLARAHLFHTHRPRSVAGHVL